MGEKIKLTPAQEKAVNSRGGGLLVSAAAGSGKTKVLVERLMKRVTEENADIDSFLIITYTNAAAAELRGKIIDALSQRLGEDPGNIRLHRQLERCYRTKISTIHSFCTDVIRENAHLLKITPEFKVIDESESDILKAKVLDDVLERKYENITEKSPFSALVETVTSGRSDKKLEDLVYELYRKMQMSTDPLKWAQEQKNAMSPDDTTDAGDTIWGKALIENAKRAGEYWRHRMEKLLDEVGFDEKLAAKYGKSLEATYAGIKAFLEALDSGDWDRVKAASDVQFPRPGGISGYEDVKNVRTACKNDFKKISAVFENTSDELMSDMRAIAPVMMELIDLTLLFSEEYKREKMRKGVIDFSDQEHLALAVLIDENGVPTEAAEKIASGFTEIMVDEYQDVNAVQEAIFNAVSKGGKNIFMVGDVKQSIYRFRLADPSIFISKYLSMKDEAQAQEGEDRKVILSTNFRSRAGVLQAVNFIFKNIMSAQLGEIDYTQSEYLNPGLEFPDNGESEMEICIVDTGSAQESEDGEKQEKTEIEAQAICEKILSLRGKMQISDGSDGLRTADWGDFTILLRSVKDKAPVYSACLEANGIPVSLDKSEEFFDSTEIISVMSFLAVIDNPRQDIPLISAMRSFLFGFTSDELGRIRLAAKGDFYDALVKSAETFEKADRFLNLLEYLRRASSEMTADRLLWEIYLKTDAVAIAGAMSDGETRQNNLMALFSLAEKYESDGYKGLFGFVTYLREIARKGGAVVQSVSSENSNSVKIVSIHKSKGLEYPIAILADTAKRFNMTDARGQLPIHQRLGLGPEITDLKRRIKYPSLARMAVTGEITKETLSEEMRVLYVALTRAREKLIVFATYSDADKKLEKLDMDLASPIPPKTLESASSVGDWMLMPALMRRECREALKLKPEHFGVSDDGFKWEISILKPGTMTEKRDEVSTEKLTGDLAVDVSELEQRFAFRYAYEKAETLPSKLTATELKGSFFDSEAGEDAEYMVRKYTPDLVRPDFQRESKPLTGTEKGTALHLVMQFIDYKKCLTEENIKEEISRLCSMRIITQKQADAVEPGKILRLFKSELGDLIAKYENIKREFKFSLLLPSEKLYPGSGEDEILLQGVIDCMLEAEDKLTIIDFKTDYVNENTIWDRAQYYKGQVYSYKLAMEEITGKKVDGLCLYFFAEDKAVWL